MTGVPVNCPSRHFTGGDRAFVPYRIAISIDYRRKRGLVEEINRAVETVEEDQAAMSAAGHRQHVEEGAVEYGPSTIEAPGTDGHGDGTMAPVPPEPKGGKK